MLVRMLHASCNCLTDSDLGLFCTKCILAVDGGLYNSHSIVLRLQESTPFVQPIPGFIQPGRLIFISGIPSPNPTRFTVYLQNGTNFEPNYIGLAVDARFNFYADKNIIVCNHRGYGKWGREERTVPYFPFIPNVPFDMIILVAGHQFKVAVNNQHLLEFHHRLQPLSCIDTLRIDGNVTLTQIHFH